MIRTLIILICFVFGSSILTSGQLTKPVKWSYSQKSIGNGEIELTFNSTIDAGWHLYSTNLPEGGPIKTTFTFTSDSTHYLLVGEIVPKNKPIKEHDKIFNMDLEFFSNEAIFTQKIKVLSGQSFTVKGTTEYQSCNNETCTLDELDFSFDIAGTDTTTLKTGIAPSAKIIKPLNTDYGGF